MVRQERRGLEARRCRRRVDEVHRDLQRTQGQADHVADQVGKTAHENCADAPHARAEKSGQSETDGIVGGERLAADDDVGDFLERGETEERADDGGGAAEDEDLKVAIRDDKTGDGEEEKANSGGGKTKTDFPIRSENEV